MRRLLLALAFVAVALPARAQRPTPLPSAVVSALGPVPVVLVGDLKCNGESALGCFDGVRRVIFLDSVTTLIKATAYQTLEHEKCHVMLWDSGWHSLLANEKKEDSLCDVIGTYRALETLIITQNEAKASKP